MNDRDRQVLITALAACLPFLAAWRLEAKEKGDDKMLLYWNNEYCDAVILLDRLRDGTL